MSFGLSWKRNRLKQEKRVLPSNELVRTAFDLILELPAVLFDGLRD
jgi:hypothetical protein